MIRTAGHRKDVGVDSLASPDGSPRVLLVCSGNTCRSPIAAAFLVAHAAADGVRLDVRSAGTIARAGALASSHARVVLAERILSAAHHRAVRLDAALLAWATDVWVMTADHKAAIAQRWPETIIRDVRLLSDAAGSRGDVADPIGGGLPDYRRVADELARLVAAAWCRLSADGRGTTRPPDTHPP